MSITYDSTMITGLEYDEETIQEATYGSVVVYTDSDYVIIQSSASLETDSSVVPPPYDENGYNYNGSAPLKYAELSVILGDITDYNHISFEWNNLGTFNSYGYVKGIVTIGTVSKEIFLNSINASGTFDIDISDLAGEYSMRVRLEAKSNSSYRGYISKAALTMTDIRGVYSEVVPVVQNGFSMDSGISIVPGPYDADGYNYAALAPEKIESFVYDFGDVTSKNTITFDWATYDGDAHSINSYGEIYAKYVDQYGIEQYLYSKNLQNITDTTGTVSIDVSATSGNLSLTFTVYARSQSSYRGHFSRAILKTSNIQLT